MKSYGQDDKGSYFCRFVLRDEINFENLAEIEKSIPPNTINEFKVTLTSKEDFIYVNEVKIEENPIGLYTTVTRTGYTLGYHIINERKDKNDQASFNLYRVTEVHQVLRDRNISYEDAKNDLKIYNDKETIELVANLKIGPNHRPTSYTHHFDDGLLAALQCSSF